VKPEIQGASNDRLRYFAASRPMRWSKQKSFKLMMAIADGEFVGSARRQ
jgi:hypothetical protein